MLTFSKTTTVISRVKVTLKYSVTKTAPTLKSLPVVYNQGGVIKMFFEHYKVITAQVSTRPANLVFQVLIDKWNFEDNGSVNLNKDVTNQEWHNEGKIMELLKRYDQTVTVTECYMAAN